MTDDEIEVIQQRIETLLLEHKELDHTAIHMSENPFIDQLKLQRIKKRKLQLKDMIHRFESMLIPDIPA